MLVPHKMAMGPLQASFQATMETTSGQELIQTTSHPLVIEIPVDHQVLIVLNIHSILITLAARALPVAHLQIRVIYLPSSSENVKVCIIRNVCYILWKATIWIMAQAKQNKTKTTYQANKVELLASSPYSSFV